MFKGFSGLFRVHYAGILLTGVLAGNVTGNDLIALTEHNRYYFEAIYRSENFSFGIIEDIQEDRFGFIWIGSKDGLFRYDGTEFIPYFFERSNPESVSSNVIRELFLDSDGALWVGTENGLNKYIDETDNFHRYFFDGDKNHPPAWNIRQIAEKDGELLISTIDGGLVILNKRSEVIERYTKNTTGKAISSNALRTVFIDSEGIIWLGSIDNGVEFMIPGEGNTHRLPVGLQDGNHLHGTNIRSITEATDGTIWIGTNGDGISIYNKQKKSFTYLVHSDTDENSLSSNNVSKIVRDSRGRLWVCTDGGGLNLYNPWEHSFTCFRPGKDKAGSITSSVVRIIYEDRAGNFWIGNYSGPLNYLDARRKDFGLIRTNDQKNSFINSNNISALFVDSRGNIWVGNDGLSVFNPRTGKMDFYPELPVKSHEGKGNVPLSFGEDEDENIWIGMFDGGLFCYRTAEKKFINYYPGPGSLRGYQVWDLLVDGDSIWLATEWGLDVFLPSQQKFYHFPVTKNEGRGTNSGSIWKLLKDSKGRILVGTNEGLCVFNPDTKKFSYYEPVMDDSTSLSNKWIFTVYEDSQNRIWIGTNGGGLNLWHEENSTFSCFNTESGLSGNVVYGILEDGKGYLWLTTNNGITRFAYDSLYFETYDVRDGLQDNRFNINVACSDNTGKFYLGGINGINIFYPLSVQKNDYLPPVYITGFEVFNRRVRVGSKESPFTKNFHLQEEIEINYKDRMFTIQFAALNYTLPAKNQYRYKLVGFDDHWNMVGNKTEATYTHLSAGKYTFLVEASNNDHVWSRNRASLRIIVRPPFYLTWWFIILMSLLVITLVYRIYQYRVMTIRLLNTKLAGMVSERTGQVEKRNLEIASQNEEITRQRDLATTQRDQIIKQNEELEKHRNRLEELIEERTRELVEAKELAEESDRLKTAFLENISHEIRTPMNAIVGFINLLSEKIDDEQSRSYYMRIINESGRSMLRLVQDVIDFSRMQTGQLQPEYIECNASDIIRRMVTTIREKASREKPRLNILTDLPEKDIEMITDGKKLTQLFSKLLENSLKFTASGHITVGVKDIGEKNITFFVQDTGPGIEEEHADKIFERFFSQPHDLPENFRGTGLGLAFARLVTEMLDGRIWFESELGKGSVFYFTLPFFQVMNGPKPGEKSKQVTYSWPDKTVLVAEDEESNYLLIEAILKETGVKLIRAADGVELLEKISDGRNLDLVLLDLKMPRMNGINALKIIRESNSELPVIVQTAYDHTNHRDLCGEIGCNDFLVKPLRKAELLMIVKKYLG